MHKSIGPIALSVVLLSGSHRAFAQDIEPQQPAQDAPATEPAQPSDAGQDARPKAIEYSEGYALRAKIHRYASFATLPLFATEVALGQSVYNAADPRTSSARNAHIAVGTAITTLFAVNSVTGVWNLLESRKDPNHRTKRMVHGILMLAADAGFVATFATGPSHEEEQILNYDANRQTHRAIAVTSMGLATAGYLMMLFGSH